jgi:hypothetical protein
MSRICEVGKISSPFLMARRQEVARVGIPNLSLLSFKDQAQFCELRRQFAGRDSRYHRNQRMEIFDACFAVMRSFCIRNDETDWVRCLVCGVIWLDPDEIAVNVQQLRYVLGKCKSSINGAFKRMDYDGVPLEPDQVKRITTRIPYLKVHPLELRKWSIRRFAPHQQMNGAVRDHEKNDFIESGQMSRNNSLVDTEVRDFGHDLNDGGNQDVDGDEEWDWFDESFGIESNGEVK